MDDKKIGWKERFAATVILCIGMVLLILQVISIISSRTTTVSGNETTLSINKSELVNHVRFVVFILLAFIAGILLYRQIRWGWIMGVPLLLLSVILAGYFAWLSFELQKVNAGYISLITCFLILLSSLVILLLPSTQQKYRVSKRTFLLTLVYLLALGALYLYLH